MNGLSINNPGLCPKLYFLFRILFRRQKWLLVTSLILGILAECLAMVMPSLTGNLAASLSDYALFRKSAYLFLGVGLLQFLFAVTNDVFDRLLKNRLGRDADSFAHDHLLALDARYYDSHTQGEELKIISSTNSVACMLLQLVCFPFFYGGGLICGLLVLYNSLRQICLPTWLCMLITLGMAIQPLITWYFGKMIAKAFVFIRALLVKINDHLLNDLRNPQELQNCNAVSERNRRFFNLLHQNALAHDKALLLHIASRYSMTLMILLLQFAIVVAVLTHYNPQAKIIKDLVASILVVPMMYLHLDKLQQLYNSIKDNQADIVAAFEFFQTQNSISDGAYKLHLNTPPRIEVNGLSFSYDSKSVLEQFSYSFEAGRTTAIVAPSGGGKTTLLKMLCRWYAPAAGKILINGVDIGYFSLQSLRENICCLSQTPLFLRGSVLENFQLFKPAIQPAELCQLAEESGIDRLLKIPVEQLPEFPLTLGAENLSGGQLKLLALTRILAVKPKIILLDEPSVGIDGETLRQYVMPLIARMKLGSTILVIDHNMNFIKDISDNLVVMRDGGLCESGKTAELACRQDSLFYSCLQKWNNPQI